MAAVFRAAVGAAARPVLGLGAVGAEAGETAGLPQRLLRAGFRDPLRDDSVAHRAGRARIMTRIHCAGSTKPRGIGALGFRKKFEDQGC